jgi:ABC-type transport system substrate-binding protein
MGISGPTPGGNTTRISRRDVFTLAASAAVMGGVPDIARAAGPAGQLTYAVHISLAPTWFDPAETPSLVTPYMLYYALHDAMLKPMPGELAAHSLAESWSATEDGMSYSFVLRDGVTFHSGEKVTPSRNTKL